ncbi:endonuclease/exonuclease/phosphatase family protein [bacterium]|nr:MAG: endonuclease/exonuclease/phosphatase family protein [bacterium]
MKLTTLNLQGFSDWQQREPKIIRYLQHEKPDIIFFQEVVYIPELSAYTQVHQINTSLKYLFEHHSITRRQVGIEYPVYREGLSIISKSPIVKTDAIILKRASGDEHDRIIQLVDLFINDHVVKFVHVHFSITDITDYATAQLLETLDILHARGEQRIIIGDFNLSNLDASRHAWDQNYISSESAPYVSYPSETKRIDYILIPKTYAFESVHTSNEAVSDHRALTVVIRQSL